MMRERIIQAMCFGVLFSLIGATGCDTRQTEVKVTNPLDEERLSETISVDLKASPALCKFAKSKRPCIYSEHLKKNVLCQTIDSDGDGESDEVVFQADFGPGQTQVFHITECSSASDENVVVRTNAMFVPWRKDDFAWENDKIAFRMYGPELQRTELTSSGIDVWVKSVKYPVMEKLYSKGDEYYHHDNGEGFDFYTVGESLGCGGLGALKDNKVCRSENFVSWKLIANGPIRSVFELTYKPWKLGDKISGEKKRISLDLGSNFNRIESYFEGDINDAMLVVGIVSCALGGNAILGGDKAWLSYWHNPDAVNGSIGCAVILPKEATKNKSATADNHNLLLVKLSDSRSVAYYAGACWSKQADFSSEEKWLKYVRKKKLLLENPLKVEVLPK